MMTVTPITLGQKRQFGRFITDAVNRALNEVGLDKESFQLFLGRGDEFMVYLLAGVRRFSAKASDYDLARKILGNGFVSPEEVSKSRKLVYTDAQLAMFFDTLPQQDVLEWCSGNNMMLLAGPPTSMNLLEVRELYAPYFYSKKDGWYAERKQAFSRTDKVEACWYMIRKEPVSDSTRKDESKQLALLSNVEYVPNVAEMGWAVTTYKAVRGIYLLPGVYVRTSSRNSNGHSVVIGDFDAGGLYVSGSWDGNRHGSLGLASARKP